MVISEQWGDDTIFITCFYYIMVLNQYCSKSKTSDPFTLNTFTVLTLKIVALPSIHAKGSTPNI